MGNWCCVNQSHPCGTTACIAGWAAILSRTKKDDVRGIKKATGEVYSDSSDSSSWGSQGRQALELDYSQSERLFYEDRWPWQFLSKTSDPSENVANAIARIDHFIKTNGAE